MNEFDTILRQIVQVIADDAISDYTKNEAIDTIKQAIEKHVIGEDESHRVISKQNPTDSYVYRSELRSRLRGEK